MKNKIDTSNLKDKYNHIIWSESVGKTIFATYQNIKYEIQIIDYIRKNNRTYLIVKYNDNKITISSSGLLQCNLGELFDVRTSDFKIEIGARFKDDKRDITIIDRKKIRGKWYKYKCNKCGFDGGEHYKNGEYKEELWATEPHILDGQGCACCCRNPSICVSDINSIYTQSPHLVKYFKNIEDTYKYTTSSGKTSEFICPDCKNSKKMKISVFNRQGIGCICGNGGTYPERFMYILLKLLNVNFNTHNRYEWSKNIEHKNSKLCGDKEYDFAFEYNKDKYIIETHGNQHYKYSGFFKSLKEEQENDRIKKELALANGIKEENYIVIDCRKSELEWIKNNIFKSRLADLFDLSIVDWLEINEFSMTNIIKYACGLFNEGIGVCNIAKELKVSRQTIRKYLKRGKIQGWCDYKF